MNIIIPEDDNYKYAIIDFRDIVYGKNLVMDLNDCILATEKSNLVVPGNEVNIANIKKYIDRYDITKLNKFFNDLVSIQLKAYGIETAGAEREMKVIFIPKGERKMYVGIPYGDRGVQSIKIQFRDDNGYYITVDNAGAVPIKAAADNKNYVDGCGMDEHREDLSL